MDSLEVRAKRALDDIVELTSKMAVSNEGRLKVSGLLSDVATEFERASPTLAETFIVGKREDSSYRDQQTDLNYLVQIIAVLERERIKPAQGGYIIKKLNALRNFYKRAEEV